MGNDDNFNFLFNEAREKIPWLFRFTRRRYKIALIVMLVSFVIMLIMTTVFYNSAQMEIVPSTMPAQRVLPWRIRKPMR